MFTFSTRLRLAAAGAAWVITGAVVLGSQPPSLDARLAKVLERAGFTGRIEASLERRLGRRLDPELVDVGRLLFFDNINGLHQDNSCAGCHSPAFG